MAYNVFYTSIPVLVSVLDKDLSEETVMQHPQILFYCQAGRFDFITLSTLFFQILCIRFYNFFICGDVSLEIRLPVGQWSLNSQYQFLNRLLNPSTFAGWFGRSLFHVSPIFFFYYHRCTHGLLA